MSSVLEKIDLPDQRRVILNHAFTSLTNIFRRAQVREESKVVNQMRLVVIVTIHRGSTESVERESHGVMTLQRPEQMRHERFLQQVKPLCWRFGYAQPLAKFYGRNPPKRLQVNM